MLINLVSNAIKFTDEGEVGIEVGLGDAADVPDGRCRLVFVVSDTGIGISPEDKRRIFESFAQVDASTTRIYGGTGLGLSIASHLIGLMDGHIDVDSKVGEGSTFTFTAVVEEADADAVVPAQESTTPVVAVPAEVTIDFGEMTSEVTGDTEPEAKTSVLTPQEVGLPRGLHVPIIASTAHAMAGDRERFLEAGMDAYVPKPVNAAVLLEAMAGVLGVVSF